MLILLNKMQKNNSLNTKLFILLQGNSTSVDSLNDQKDYHAMKMAMEVCDFQKQDQDVRY